MSDKTVPRWEHDCDRCKYLGTDAAGRDWYLCGDCLGRTLVIREGNEPENNASHSIGISGLPSRLEIHAARMGFAFSVEELAAFGRAALREAMQRQSMRELEQYAGTVYGLPAAEDTVCYRIPGLLGNTDPFSTH